MCNLIYRDDVGPILISRAVIVCYFASYTTYYVF